MTEDFGVFSGKTGLELDLHNNNDSDSKTSLVSHVYCEKLTMKLHQRPFYCEKVSFTTRGCDETDKNSEKSWLDESVK